MTCFQPCKTLLGSKSKFSLQPSEFATLPHYLLPVAVTPHLILLQNVGQMQLKALEQEISDIHAKHPDALTALAAAEQAGDAAEIDLQRKRALELGDQNLTLLKQETVLQRRVLALGQLCCHHHLPVCETPRLGTGTVNAVHTQIALTDLQSMSPKILA